MNPPLVSSIRCVGAVIALGAFFVSKLSAAEPAVLPLWANGAPGSEAKKNLPETKAGNNVSNIHNPSATIYLPEPGKATGAAVVVLPGGGHRNVVLEKEGTGIAKWLVANGVAGIVVKYRLANEPESTYRIEVEELQDTQRAIRLVHAHAKEWGIDPAKIGVMGFSAGGELVSLSSMHYDSGNPGATDPIDRQDCKPAFQALIYPGAADKAMPTKDSPPAFIACGIDDRPEISEGSARLYLRFKAAGVSAELHIYSGIGHGFALRPGPSESWAPRFITWLDERFAPPKPAAPAAAPAAKKG